MQQTNLDGLLSEVRSLAATLATGVSLNERPPSGLSRDDLEPVPIALRTWWCDLGGRGSSEVLDVATGGAAPS
jgi:hypothetical protein